MELELFKQVIDLFCQKVKRERLQGFLAKPKRHIQLINEFHSSSVFEQSVLRDIPGSEQTPEGIYLIMKALGSGDECFDILETLDENCSSQSLRKALKDCVGSLCETVLFCPEAGIAYYEGGHAKDRYILQRNK